jgi:hypothetical protein
LWWQWNWQRRTEAEFSCQLIEEVNNQTNTGMVLEDGVVLQANCYVFFANNAQRLGLCLIWTSM